MKYSPDKAWNSLIKNCRWQGIEVTIKKPSITKINGFPAILLGTANLREDWELNFNGAWCIKMYLDPKKKKSWSDVAVLVHEIGHVLDFRTNMFNTSRGVLDGEIEANAQALKLLEVLEIPAEEIKKKLAQILEEYRAVYGEQKCTTTDTTLVKSKKPKKKV